MFGELETVRTLVELGVEKEAKTDLVRNLMMVMVMVIATSSVATIMMIVGDDTGDSR